MQIQGTVFRIMPETCGTSSRGDWTRQDVVFIVQNGTYEHKVAVTFFNKRTEVQGLIEGVVYDVSFNIESREYNEKWYTEVKAWKVAAVNAGAPTQAPTQAQPAEEGDNDLPF